MSEPNATGGAALELEGLGDWRRSHTCGELRKTHAGSTATLMGWVHRVRDHGGVLFVDLRDRYGLTQVVFHPEQGAKDIASRAALMGNEWVIAVRGIVTLRPAEAANNELPTGHIELDVHELKLMSACDPLPFQVNDDTNLANEDLRLRYRYLDLRRPEISRVLELRHRVAQAVRRHLSAHNFLEVETPILVKPTPEGARDYVVPSRVHPGSFYALPQSPQLYKQTLMIAGCDRYFQLARCLRDEDLRADRQPEHTQIDLEMSFVSEDDVFDAVEQLYCAVWKECLGIEVPRPFPRLTFREAMLRFGSDKPDVRFGLEFTDVTHILSRSPRNVIAKGAAEKGGIGVAMCIETSVGKGTENCELKFTPEAKAIVLAGSTNHGQGHETVFVQYVTGQLGIPPEDIEVVESDTRRVKKGNGTGGSGSAAYNAAAIGDAIKKCVEQGKAIAARLLQVAPEIVTFDLGHYNVEGGSQRISFGDVVRASFDDGGKGLQAMGEAIIQAHAFPNGCHVSEVEIDPETGVVEMVAHTICDDVGFELNPLLVKGQLMGGIAQGAGQALMENLAIDADGQVLTGSFMDYAMPRATDISRMTLLSHPVPTATNPYGVKGVGESGTVGSLPAVMNAINNALTSAGAQSVDMPATLAKVWNALRAAKS